MIARWRRQTFESTVIIAIVLALAGISALAHIAPFPFLLDAATGGATIWKIPVSGSAKTIYLTFDDGPNPAATPALLDLLKQKEVQATFFVIGEYVTGETSPIVRRMFAEGHSVGQHTGRRWLLLRSPTYLAEMLKADADKIQRLSGSRPCGLFRPHAGWRSVSMIHGAERAKYKVVGWSWMSWDWVWFRRRTGPRVATQVISHAAPGSIVVIHDGHHRNPRADRQYAIDATNRIIDELRGRGYSFGTLCSVL